MTGNKFLLMLLASSLLFAASSCKKDTDDDKDDPQNVNYQTLSEDASTADNVSNDLFKVVDNESKNGDHNGDVGKTSNTTYISSLDTCAVVTIDLNGGNWPKTLTIDFGSGCTDAYGTVRKGKVMASYSGPYQQAGSVITVTVDNYYVNDYKLEGSKTITNDGRNADSNWVFTVRDVGIKIIKPDGGVISWESERTNEWVEGEGTSWWVHGISGLCDDVYHIEGEASGTTSDGQTFLIETVDPLVKEICCHWVVDGSLKYTINGQEVATVDYGDGTCDYNANLTYGNNTYVIVIQ